MVVVVVVAIVVVVVLVVVVVVVALLRVLVSSVLGLIRCHAVLAHGVAVVVWMNVGDADAWCVQIWIWKMCGHFVLTVLLLLCCVICGDAVGVVDVECSDSSFGFHV